MVYEPKNPKQNREIKVLSGLFSRNDSTIEGLHISV